MPVLEEFTLTEPNDEFDEWVSFLLGQTFADIEPSLRSESSSHPPLRRFIIEDASNFGSRDMQESILWTIKNRRL